MSDKKKILILAENLDIQITSSSRTISKIAVALSKHYEIDILYDPKHHSDFKWLPGIEMIPIEPIKNYDGISFGIGDKINSRLTGFAYREHERIAIWADAVQKAMSHKKYDAILALASGVEYYTHHALAKSDTTVPILAYYHDPYPWLYYPATYRNKKSLLIQKGKAKSLSKILKKATANLFPSKKLAESFLKYYKFSENSVTIAPHLMQPMEGIYNWQSGNTIDVKSTYFNVTYAGALHPSRKVETLVEAFLRFLKKVNKPDQVFLNFIGPKGVYKEYIESKTKAYPNNIRCSGRVGYDQSLEHLKNSQINVIIEADDVESPFLPGKLPDYVLINRPIVHIGPEDSEVIRLLGKDYPFAVRHGEVEKLVEIFASSFEKYKKSGDLTLNRPDLEKYLSPHEFLKSIDSILEL